MVGVVVAHDDVLEALCQLYGYLAWAGADVVGDAERGRLGLRGMVVVDEVVEGVVVFGPRGEVALPVAGLVFLREFPDVG